MNKENERARILEIIFVVAFFILVSTVVWYLLKNISAPQEINYNRFNGDAQAIMAATDNAINKIYNILVISTVFFTILVASVSVFQFIKMKDVDKLKRELKSEITKNKKSIKKRLENYDLEVETLAQKYSEKTIELEKNSEMLIQNLRKTIDLQIKQLTDKSVKLDIDTTYLKIVELRNKTSYNILELKKHYDNIIDLLKMYPEVKELPFKEKVFLDTAYFYSNSLSFIESYEIYEIAKNLISEVLKTTEDIFIESNANRLMADLEMRYHPNESREIPYLESVVEQNNYDLEATLLLMISYDKRFSDEDPNKMLLLAKQAIDLTEDEARKEICNLVKENLLKNIVNSEMRDEFQELIKFSE
ncbi:hypothetical protein [Paenibacillus xylanexedens]|uniref:hypothetical protein n=1 Tax=Paenibacillus xylanexedens TaxID=528191 RepID=UPI00119CABE7|nr:hypothetical protein [Paenibacillus xylanexedens]